MPVEIVWHVEGSGSPVVAQVDWMVAASVRVPDWLAQTTTCAPLVVAQGSHAVLETAAAEADWPVNEAFVPPVAVQAKRVVRAILAMVEAVVIPVRRRVSELATSVRAAAHVPVVPVHPLPS